MSKGRQKSEQRSCDALHKLQISNVSVAACKGQKIPEICHLQTSAGDDGTTANPRPKSELDRSHARDEQVELV